MNDDRDERYELMARFALTLQFRLFRIIMSRGMLVVYWLGAAAFAMIAAYSSTLTWSFVWGFAALEFGLFGLTAVLVRRKILGGSGIADDDWGARP